MDQEQRDFFVSYTSVDEEWATWIAHVLEDAGYSVVIQAWDFRPGSNFVVEMQRALQSSKRLIAVLTPAYLQARYPQAEWSAVFAADPEGTSKKLVPVMVQQCEPAGLLSQVVQIRIHDLDEPTARRRLIEGVQAGRAKPAGPPSFPGRPAPSPGSAHVAVRPDALVWQRQPTPPQVVWRNELENRIPNQSSGYEAVELHLVPVGDDARLQVRDLTNLTQALPAHGRQHDTFTAVGALDVRSNGTAVVVTSTDRGTVAGLAVTRSGQRSTWSGLPRDMLGAVLDEENLASQLAKMLTTLIELPVSASELVTPAVGIEPARLVSVGKVSDLPRSSAQLGHGMPAHIRPSADDAVTIGALRAHRDDVAIELAARLAVEHTTVARIG